MCLGVECCTLQVGTSSKDLSGYGKLFHKLEIQLHVREKKRAWANLSQNHFVETTYLHIEIALCSCYRLVLGAKKTKTYNSGDSLVVTHLTTNPPVHCLYMAERTGSLIFSVLWSYVQGRK
jgi:hypothetical protein